MMSRSPERLVVASRGSRLALTQAEIVAQLVRATHPELQIEIKPVRTRGDADHRPFHAIGGKGLFVKEVERALLDGEADIAVHSAKDLTAELGPGCSLVCVPERASTHDVVIGGDGDTGEARLGSLRSGATVGTSSMRRRALLAEIRGDVEVVELRGNLDTRVAKVTSGEMDAAILAAAGLERLSGLEVSWGPLDPSRWVPAPAQGALAVEALADRADVAELFAPLEDTAARAAVESERSFAAHLEGGCSVPLGCAAALDAGTLVVIGYLGDPEGPDGLRDRISGPPADAVGLGIQLAEAILASGGAEILERIRATVAPEVSAP
jgi:hydroxymethylbilane synthase